MSFDLAAFADKLIRYRNQFKVSIEEVSASTGIKKERLEKFEIGNCEPNGDEVLILSDYYKCDYNFFISNEKQTAFEKTELLFRKYGNELSSNDRWAIQECIYYAECESYLDSLNGLSRPEVFSYAPKGKYYKGQGVDAAKKLRESISLRANEFNLDIYSDFRKAGFLIYRRKLENSTISGVCIDYSSIGKLILVNYDEDIYRQRFTMAHEVGHAIFDNEEGDIALSYSGKWSSSDLKEVRANAFAATFLVPDELVNTIPDNRMWDRDKLIFWANKIKVNTRTLLIALRNRDLVSDLQSNQLSQYKVNSFLKTDPETRGLSSEMLKRTTILFERGLTYRFLNKCFSAQREGKISLNRMAEMLLININEIPDINRIFKLGLENAS